ncbi:unnamed protein product [Sphagnum troendelagicum]|uniref:Uncharacterized protein n=1 Tax=Sphagnum troendelagicum TaxID=128251 RepID=A0ABP0U1N6_9BRYO
MILWLQETHSRRFYHCEMQLYTVNVHYLTRKQQDSMLTSSGKSPSALLWIKKHALGWLGILFICDLLRQTEDDQEVCAHTIYCTNIGKKVKWNPNSGVIHSSYHVGSASWEWNIFP